MNIIENNLRIQATAFSHSLPFLEKLYGARVEIFPALDNPSHYKTSSKFSYNSIPNEVRQIVITNSYQEVQTSGTIYYDPETSEQVFAFTQIKNKLPVNAKLKIHKGSSYHQYRVDNNAVEINGINGNPVYIRYRLIPHV